jgi:hypothetical protein
MSDEIHVFRASRLTRTNHFFPARIEISPERVTLVKPGFFSSNEESISIPNVASVNIASGAVWSDIRIDSSGGTNPIRSHGHSQGDARRMRELIETFQSRKS